MTDQPDPGGRDRWARLRLASCGEVRNCEAVRGSAVWHLELHAGSVLTAHGTCAKPLAVVVDDRSRFVLHVQRSRDATVDSLVDALCRALIRRGLPRAVETDNARSGKRSPRRSTQK
jgi:transposase InsO family protein